MYSFPRPSPTGLATGCEALTNAGEEGWLGWLCSCMLALGPPISVLVKSEIWLEEEAETLACALGAQRWSKSDTVTMSAPSSSVSEDAQRAYLRGAPGAGGPSACLGHWLLL